MKLWDLRTNKVIKEFTKHSFDVVSVLFIGDSCISASKDGTIGAWHFTCEESGYLQNIPDTRLITSMKVLENLDDKTTIAISSFDGSLSFEELVSESGADPVLKHIYNTPAIP